MLIECEPIIAPQVVKFMRGLTDQIHQSEIKGIIELNYVYYSLLVVYNNHITCFSKVKEAIKKLYQNSNDTFRIRSKTWHIPVCYSQKFGIDLLYVAKKTGYSVREVIEIHVHNIYMVYGIGFLPGFLYLGGLAQELHLARRVSPRLRIPKGSVAIGGKQTGIYPQDSPGGWHIIGKSPVVLFNPHKNPPCAIEPGDSIQFYPI